MIRLVLAVALAASPAAALAQVDGKHHAYDYALRCFVANGVLAGRTNKDPNSPDTADIKAHARDAYDAVYKVGAALGYPKKQISEDLKSYARAEARRLETDATYFDRTQSDCVKLGLM